MLGEVKRVVSLCVPLFRYLQNGEFIKDDAPFSCCDMTAPRPCVHHDVLNVSAHRFVGTRGTLYTEGCSYALITFWKTYVIYPTFVALIILIFMHASISRLL